MKDKQTNGALKKEEIRKCAVAIVAQLAWFEK
jgi:hypothetical protein